ncbi:MAG: tRNA (N6-isopentenyl adenosine(37)-C2)-methylthiotransferase MiaB [Deltaproteobacteria bacterium]|nr:tRNA (N6-isopentenyl adenosine(37)-C2)-methylthiotransferase MiaB [Deltaproteobacteria bacterium]
MSREMRNKYFYIQTFGCQMNVHDSEQIAALLAAEGYEQSSNMNIADLIILNTCSIREKAEQKVLSQLGRIEKLKKQNPGLIIGVGGCLAQHLGTKFHKKVRSLDFVFGTHSIHLLPDIIASIKAERKKITEIDFHKSLMSLNIFAEPSKDAISSFMTIMQGCNNFCSYCVVPYLRGPEISRPIKDILEETKKLADLGIREVTLLGQNVNSYGKNLNDGSNFTALIKKIAEISGIKRIRFTTSHPRDLSLELMNCFAEEEKLCRHIHLPVQSGSNRILSLMNRGYTIEEYIKKIDYLRKITPEISITSDIIVGFPGETEKDYQETIDMMEKIRFDSTFSFKYSERDGTAAKKLKEKVLEEEKLRRLEVLQELQNRHTLEKNTALEGSIQELLVEGRSKNSESDLMGRTSSWKIVNFKGESDLIGKMVNVKVLKAYLHSLRGKIESNQEMDNVN